MVTDEKPWKWFLFRTGNQSSADVALECQNVIDDWANGFPKMIRGRNLCGVAIAGAEDKKSLIVKVVQDPTCKKGGTVLYDSEAFVSVVEPDAELCSRFGTAIGRQELFKPNLHETSQIHQGKKDFENLKGGK
jgi:hypothetical protein